MVHRKRGEIREEDVFRKRKPPTLQGENTTHTRKKVNIDTVIMPKAFMLFLSAGLIPQMSLLMVHVVLCDR